jgi:hypothetical protein
VDPREVFLRALLKRLTAGEQVIVILLPTRTWRNWQTRRT